MRKRIVSTEQLQTDAPEKNWLDLEQLVEVELTSEDPHHPIESALIVDQENGWRAAEPGQQTIRLIFTQPTTVKSIHLRFKEAVMARTQEYILRWSADKGSSLHEIVRQQWNFNPDNATLEDEQHQVNLKGIDMLELQIIPDINGGEAIASLEELQLSH